MDRGISLKDRPEWIYIICIKVIGYFDSGFDFLDLLNFLLNFFIVVGVDDKFKVGRNSEFNKRLDQWKQVYTSGNIGQKD